jgi:hypothetical protein
MQILLEILQHRRNYSSGSRHPRRLLSVLQARLAARPITVLTGARQTGKTTIVRDLLPAAGNLSSVYSSLDDPDERLRLPANPVRRLDHGARVVVLDEIQKQPGLLDAVKLLADRGDGRRFLQALDRVLAIEVKASQRAHRTDARPLTEVLNTLAVRGVQRNAWRLGLVVTRGREVEPLAPGVWAIPDWRLFGPAG